MSENDLKRIWDAWDACRRILEFTKGLSEEAFQDSEMVQSAVERQFEICGEALGHLRGEEEIEMLVPDLHKIVGLRNRLIHGYDSIDYEMLWSVVAQKIPELHRQLASVLQESGFIERL
jgi:uncharacterized protein with HEPN domain